MAKALPVDMLSRRLGYFPWRFVCQERTYAVKTVMQCWDTGNKHVSRHYFKVDCGKDGVVTVYQNLKTFTWWMEAKTISQETKQDVALSRIS